MTDRLSASLTLAKVTCRYQEQVIHSFARGLIYIIMETIIIHHEIITQTAHIVPPAFAYYFQNCLTIQTDRFVCVYDSAVA